VADRTFHLKYDEDQKDHHKTAKACPKTIMGKNHKRKYRSSLAEDKEIANGVLYISNRYFPITVVTVNSILICF
jgi:hypothetical protein